MKISPDQVSEFLKIKILNIHYANRRVGQEFLNWLSEEYDWNGSDPDLFYEENSEIAWQKIFDNYVDGV